MKGVLVDANVIYINTIIYTEVSVGFKKIEELESARKVRAMNGK